MTAFRSACLKRFSPYSVECGEDLVRSSSVSLVERIEEESVAIVSRPGSAKMFASCTCKLFSLGLDGCRHLWALVATIDDTKLVPMSMLPHDFELIPKHPPAASFWIGARRALAEAREERPPLSDLRRAVFAGREESALPPRARRRRRR